MLYKEIIVKETYGRYAHLERSHAVRVIIEDYNEDGENIGVPQDGEVVYFSVYEVTRHYGGPEEGGWWYDLTRLVVTMPFIYSSLTLNAFCDTLNPRKEVVPGGESVGLTNLVVTTPVSNFTIDTLCDTMKPHYEVVPGGDINSVNGGSECFIVVERKPGSRQDLERPHYE